MAKRKVLEGGAAPKVKRAGRRTWSAAREKRFLETLATSCNVTLAAAEAGLSSTVIYRRRRTDASFRRAWGEALAIGYAELEMMMLRRALHGVERTIVARNGETSVMTEYNDRTGLALLKMHRDFAKDQDEGVSSEAHEEACERILARLQRLRERDGGIDGEDGAVATKGWDDRLAIIREALSWARGA